MKRVLCSSFLLLILIFCAACAEKAIIMPPPLAEDDWDGNISAPYARMFRDRHYYMEYQNYEEGIFTEHQLTVSGPLSNLVSENETERLRLLRLENMQYEIDDADKTYMEGPRVLRRGDEVDYTELTYVGDGIGCVTGLEEYVSTEYYFEEYFLEGCD